ncbi:MAG: 4-hydroxyacetophenone monooxygenase [Actinomycetota bacterium]|nr:4-hydroxyacetophenone monooxygenase [Actinomycetota bacterium]
MPLEHETLPITEDDDVIRSALRYADVPALLPALAYATGDLTLLRPDLRPDPNRMLEPDAGISEEQKATAYDLAFDALVALRDSGGQLAVPPGPDDLRAMLEFAVGGVDMEDYLQLFREELAVGGEDLRAPQWRKADLAPDRPFLVGIVGAGMSGLVAAHRLDQAGVPYVIIEKNDDVGGTWLENTYPGCRVDVPNHFYSYSFAQRDDWPQHFSSQDVLLDYFRTCADEFGIREHIRFGTEVMSASFDDEHANWTLALRSSDGREDTLEVQALISAVGQLNRPSWPDIAGRDHFAGASFHSAQWDHSVDLRGKRVAVIGTGASAVQFIPVVAEQAASLVVFQRTAPWLVPTPDYHEEVAGEIRWLLRHVPSYAHWYRFWLFWRNAEGMLPLVAVDPEWEPQERSVSALNEMLRMLLAGYLDMEFGDRPDLLAQVTPDYPPSAKRVIRDNGIWARTLKRENVQLVTEKISEITPAGVMTADGVEHDVDVIIYGTGFQASRFLTPMKVVGRGGADLHQEWDGNARAYLGVVVPRFPNLFLLYGPNTNIVINGSIIYFSECEVHYLVECLRLLLETGQRALDCRQDVHDTYNVRIDEGNLQRAWGVSKVNSWYKNEKGRVAQNWPFSLLEYWRQTRTADPSDYELL